MSSVQIQVQGDNAVHLGMNSASFNNNFHVIQDIFQMQCLYFLFSCRTFRSQNAERHTRQFFFSSAGENEFEEKMSYIALSFTLCPTRQIKSAYIHVALQCALNLNQ